MAEPTTLAPELDLRQYLRVLWRRKWIVALAAAVLATAAYANAARKPELYQASASVLVERSLAENIFSPVQGGGVFVDPQRALANQIRVIQSTAMAERVEERLGYTAGVSAGADSETDTITITSIDGDPARAAAVANAYAEEFVGYRRTAGIGDTAPAEAEIQRRIDESQARLDALDDEILNAAPAEREDVRQRVSSERAQLQSTIFAFRQQQEQLRSAARVAGTGSQILTEASAPNFPFEPRPKREAAQALMVGLVLGLGLAFLLDFLDDRIRSKEDVDRAAPGMAILGFIPHVGRRGRKADRQLVTRHDPTSLAAEAYRALRTSIQFAALDRTIGVLQFTSPAVGEGKSTTVANLAVALAQAGQRVIAVDCDLRRPRLSDFFGAHAPPYGLTSVLVGDAPLGAALIQVENEPNLRILPSGPIPPNPSELLSGARMVEVVGVLRADADIVILDSPPVLPVSDAVALAARADATVLVIRSDRSHRKQLTRALELLRQVDASTIGLVLNGARAGVGFGYSYAYGYGYGGYTYAQQQPRRGLRRRRQPAKVG